MDASSCLPKPGSAAAEGSEVLHVWSCHTVLPVLPQAANPMGGYNFTPMNPRVSMARFTNRMESPVPLESSVIASRKGQKGAKPCTRPPSSTEICAITSTWSDRDVGVFLPCASHQS